MKILLIVVGVLAGVFAILQLLQLLGIFGGDASAYNIIPGIALTILGVAISLACFKRAFGPPKSTATSQRR